MINKGITQITLDSCFQFRGKISFQIIARSTPHSADSFRVLMEPLHILAFHLCVSLTSEARGLGLQISKIKEIGVIGQFFK